VSRLQVVLDGDTVKAQVEPLGKNTVDFTATRIVRERTGVKAFIRIALNGHNTLAYSIMNADRNSDRVSLHNSAHAMLPEQLQITYPKSHMKADLDDFCLTLWPTYNAQFGATKVEGEPDSTVEWYCPPLIMRDAATILFAPRGGGKSMTAMTAAVSVNSGTSNIWDPITSAPVLYINLERSELSMQRRLARINTALGLNPRETLLMLSARGKSLDNIYEGSRTTVKQEGVEVIILDSISRTQMGDLRDNEPANRVVDMLSDLSKTWLAVAHLTSPEGEGKAKVFGSQMFENAADLVVKMTSQQEEDKLGVGMEIIKANDTKTGQHHFVKYTFNGRGVDTIQRTDLREFPELDARPLTLADEIAMYIDDSSNDQGTASEIARAIKRDQSYVSKILVRQTNRFFKLPKEGKEQPYGLLTRHEHEERR
jgi:KaiC/GvpD/RAD55 family RecA-like ATPase